VQNNKLNNNYHDTHSNGLLEKQNTHLSWSPKVKKLANTIIELNN